MILELLKDVGSEKDIKKNMAAYLYANSNDPKGRKIDSAIEKGEGCKSKVLE